MYDETRLRALVMAAVVEAMKDHPCRFGQVEAEVLHDLAHRLTADQITALTLLARAVNSVAARIGQAIVWGLIAAAIGGLLVLAKLGLLPSD